MSKKLKIILITIGVVLAVAVVTGGVIAISRAVTKNRQAKCNHEYGAFEIVRDATCEENGVELQICSLCGYENAKEIKALGHTEKTIPVKFATCLEPGLSDGIQCADCGKVLVEQKEIPALGHNVITVPAVNPTCISSGLTAGRSCQRCKIVIDAQQIVSATGHNIVSTGGYPATCVSVGMTDTVKCDLCNTVYAVSEEIEMLNHNYENGYCIFCEQPDLDNAVEVAVEVGELVAGNWYRIYKATDSMNPNAMYFSNSDSFGIGASSSYNGVISVPKVTYGNDKVGGNITFVDHGEYVDVYIEAGEYQLGIGPYSPESVDPDGNGYFDFVIDEETAIASVSDETKIYRLTFGN